MNGAIHTGSRWNILLPWRRGWVAVSSLTTQAAVVDEATADRLRRRAPVMPSSVTPQLHRLGIVVEAGMDEQARMAAALQRRAWAGPVLDLFVLAAPAPATQLYQIGRAIAAARAAGPLELVKLRLRSAGAPIELDAAFLAAVGDRCRRLGVGLTTLWMGERLADTLRVRGDLADSFYFRWQPGTDDDDHALDGLRNLVRLGKLIAVQIAIDDGSALLRQRRRLRSVAADPALVRARNLTWDVSVAAGDGGPGFLPGVCHRQPGAAARLARGRRVLTTLGIPVRPAIAPFHQHPGCPLLIRGACAVLASGRLVSCLVDAGDPPPPTAAAGFAPGPAATRRMAAQCAGACSGCAVLPFCLARCPRLPAPVPGSAECTQVVRAVERELGRLLSVGHLRAWEGKGAP